MPRGPRNLRISFDAEALTHYGRAVLLYQFFQRIGLRTLFYRAVRFPQRNNRYHISETLLALLPPIILGMGRLEITEPLKRNGVFQYLTGLPRYPDSTSLRRFLQRFATNSPMVQFAYMENLKSEMHTFLREAQISNGWIDGSNWVRFVELLVRVLENQPIIRPTENIVEFAFIPAAAGAVQAIIKFNQPVRGYDEYRFAMAY